MYGVKSKASFLGKRICDSVILIEVKKMELFFNFGAGESTMRLTEPLQIVSMLSKICYVILSDLL